MWTTLSSDLDLPPGHLRAYHAHRPTTSAAFADLAIWLLQGQQKALMSWISTEDPQKNPMLGRSSSYLAQCDLAWMSSQMQVYAQKPTQKFTQSRSLQNQRVYITDFITQEFLKIPRGWFAKALFEHRSFFAHWLKKQCCKHAVSIIQDALWNDEERKAICGRFRLLVGVWQVMPARASVSQFLPHNSAARQSFVVVTAC